MMILLPQKGRSALYPDYAKKVTEKALERYRNAARVFSDWMVSRHLQPDGHEQWDDLLV